MLEALQSKVRAGVITFIGAALILTAGFSVLAAGENLIQNPTLDTANGAVPQGWVKEYWGTPVPTFKYPDTGRTGNAASVTLSKASSGDARWSHTPVTVVPGQTYTFTSWYKSNAATEIDVRYQTSAGATTYGYIASLPSSANVWKQATYQVVVPANVTKMTVYHLISAAGTLTIDDYSLTQNGTTPPPPVTPVPTLSFTASPSTILQGETSTLAWSTTNATTCTASNGWTGSQTPNGTQVVGPTATTTYALTCSGQGGTTTVQAVVNVTVPVTPPPPQPGAWTEGMVSFTFDDSWTSQYTNALPILDAAGFKGTFYLATEPIVGGWSTFMTPAQAKQIDTKGHEVAGHTVTHADLPSLSASNLTAELVNSKTYLENLIGKPVVSLAYPYGAHNQTVMTATKNAGYTTARGVDYDAQNVQTTNRYSLFSRCVEKTDTIAKIKQEIDTAKANKQWYVLCFHEVKTGGDQWTTSPARLREIVNYVKSVGIKVVTVRDGASLLTP